IEAIERDVILPALHERQGSPSTSGRPLAPSPRFTESSLRSVSIPAELPIGLAIRAVRSSELAVRSPAFSNASHSSRQQRSSRLRPVPAMDSSSTGATSEPPRSRTTTLSLHALVSENTDLVYRALRRAGIDGAAADDAAQEVFMVVSRRIAVVESGKE